MRKNIAMVIFGIERINCATREQAETIFYDLIEYAKKANISRKIQLLDYQTLEVIEWFPS